MKNIFLCIALAWLLSACGSAPEQAVSEHEINAQQIENKKHKNADKADSAAKTQSEGNLVYEGKTSFSSYIDAERRGAGVISFALDINDRLDIWNLDDSKFGEIVLNEDLTYFSINMPKKIVARKVVPEYDFAAFDFDAEVPETDKVYFIIYVNHHKRKVKKMGLKSTFISWKMYDKQVKE